MFIPVSIHIKNITSHTDTFFEFKKGQSILINGENLDDVGQEKNGSGKSGLNEGVSLAITGKTIRDSSNRDLITDTKESGEVIFIMYNSKTQKNLNIHRIFYADSTPQSCKVWYDNEKPIVKANVLHYGPWILEEIGITEEDFFSYYIITKENYKPFFLGTDGAKKAVVNRFSGANEIDKVDPLIKLDIQKQEKLKIEVDQKIAVELSKVNIFQTELKELTQDTTDLQIESLREENLQQLSSLKRDLESIELEKDSNKKEVGVIEKKIEKFVNKFEEKIKELKLTESLIEDSILNFKKDIQKIESTQSTNITQIKTSIKGKETELRLIRSEINDLEREIQKLENQLEDSISCPHCYKEFNLQDENFNIEETRERVLPDLFSQKNIFEEELKGIRQEIKYFEQQEIDIKNKIEEDTKLLRESIEVEQLKLTAFSSKLRDLNQKKREEDKVLEDLIKEKNIKIKLDSTFLKQEQDLNIQINNLQKSIDNLGVVDTNRQLELESKIISSEKEVDSLKQKLQVIVDEIYRLSTWQLNFKKFKSFLANRSLSNISDYTNLFLSKIGSQLSVTLDGFRLLPDGNFKEELTVLLNRDGFLVGKYGRFSAGERGRVDFSNILAFQEISNLTAKNGLDLLILDEALDSLDSYGLGLLMEGTVDLQKTIMVISQVSIKSSLVPVLKVTKQNKISTIKMI